MHFVIFGSDSDYMKYAYSDLFSCENAEYLSETLKTKNALLRILFRLHFSEKINRVMPLPFKRIWFNKISAFNRKKEKYCFVFFATKFGLVKSGYVEYLRKRYPTAVFVCFYQDLVVTHQKELPVEHVKEVFDYVYSFDKHDCDEYGLDYHPLVYSKGALPHNSIENDVYFVGLAKNRLTDIINAYEVLTAKGLKCDFHIVGAKTNERKHSEDIDYCDNVSYSKNLEYISRSRCLLEIMQLGGCGFTLRTCEAIMFDKLLITNNSTIEKADFFRSGNVVLLEKIDSYDFTKIKNKQIFDYKYKDNLSPIAFLENISERVESAK